MTSPRLRYCGWKKRIENRVRFGRSGSEKLVDRNRRLLSFAPGSIFGFVRWSSNDFETVLSRIDILRAAIPERRYSTVPWITPGGESLLRLFGWPKPVFRIKRPVPWRQAPLFVERTAFGDLHPNCSNITIHRSAYGCFFCIEVALR